MVEPERGNTVVALLIGNNEDYVRSILIRHAVEFTTTREITRVRSTRRAFFGW